VDSAPETAGPLPIFVVGVPRSGTTWIQRGLALHPEAWPLLETYMFSRRVGLGALFQSLPPPEAGDAEELAAPGLGRIFSREELVDEVRALARRWLDRASADHCRYVIEKSPWHLSDLELIAEVLPEARFVHVVRDGRDVAVSLVAARRSWSPYGTGSPTEVLREAASLWATAMRDATPAAAELGERLLEVRYESLHADPRGQFERMLAHCRMPSDETTLDRIVAGTRFQDLPEPKGEDRLYRGGRVGDWRRRMSILDAWRFERRAGAALRDLGYEGDRRWWLRRPLRSRL
jgi:hypothetical protein